MKVSQLTTSLVAIAKALSENQYTSPDPILKELEVQNLDEAISVLEEELKVYSSRNFHPIVAQIISCLAFSYRIKGDQENWLKSMLICLNSTYKKYLGINIVKTFEEHISNCTDVKIDVIGSKIPFSFCSGFLNHSIMPNQLPTVLLEFRSQINANIKIDDISVQVKHSGKNETYSFSLTTDAQISEKAIIKTSKDIGPFASGMLTVESITLKIKNATIVFHDFNRMGHSKAVIFPFDHECDFSAKIPDYGITNTMFPIKVLVNNIPEGAVTQTCTVAVKNGKEQYSFINSDNSEIFVSNIDAPKDNTATDVELMVIEDGLLDITISVNVSFGIVSSKWKKTFQVQFYRAFNSEFAFINNDYHYSVKMQRELLQYNQPTCLISSFTYNCPKKVTVTNSRVVVKNAEYNVVDTPNCFPIELYKDEVFTVTNFITPTEEAKSGCSIGEIEVYFNDDEGNENKFTAELPEVNVVDKCVDVRLDFLPEIEEKKLYTLNIYGKTLKDPFQVDIHIEDTEDFLFDGETNRRERLNKQEGLLASLKFMALRTGELTLPTISIHFVSERTNTIIWQDTPSIFVKYQSASC